MKKIELGNFSATYVGFAVVFSGYEIISNNFIKTNTSDEFTDDPENWSSLLYASLSYNEGAENLNKINKIKIKFLNI